VNNKDEPQKIKIGLEITQHLNNELDQVWKKAGYNNRADFIRQAIIEKIEKWKKENFQTN
jgi:metal-responsive CopG/Arc/MetJ family transcriptional regulator